MNRFTTCLLAGAALLGAALPGAAFAVPLAFTAESGGLGTSVNPNTIRFLVMNDTASNTYAAGNPGVTYSSGGQTAKFVASADSLEYDTVSNYPGIVDPSFANGTQLIGPCGLTYDGTCSGISTLTITFAVPTTAFTVSVDDVNFDGPYSFTATAYGASGVLGSVTGSDDPNSNTLAVLAGLSTAPITSLVISGGDGDFLVGNIGTVPEPASIALLATGLVGLVVRRRRG